MSLLHNLTGVLDAEPGQLRAVDQAHHTPQVEKGSVLGQGADTSVAGVAAAQLAEQAFLLLSPLRGPAQPFGEDQAPLPAIDIDHLERQLLPDELGQAGEPLAICQALGDARDLRGGDEPADMSKGYDQAAFVIADDAPFPESILAPQLLGPQPVLLLLRQVQRELHRAGRPRRSGDIDKDLLALTQRRPFVRGDLLQVGPGDPALLGGTEIDGDALWGNGQDRPPTQVAGVGPPAIFRRAKEFGHSRPFLLPVERISAHGHPPVGAGFPATV